MKHRQRLRKPRRRWFCIQTILPGLTLPHSPRCAAPQGLHHEKKHSAVKIMSAFKTELKQFKNRWKNIYVCVNWNDNYKRAWSISKVHKNVYFFFVCFGVLSFIKVFLFHVFDMPLIKGLEISAWSQSSRARLASFHLSLYWKYLKLWKSLKILLRWLMTGILHGLAIFFVVITSPFSLFFVIHRVWQK